jgi:transcriptional regulator with XRE-family HTH domain
VTEDWAAVARAINQRMAELGMRQIDLVERSRVSKAIVGEIVRNSVRRRRSARTLESLSTALSWHPQHLQAVLHGRRPPAVGEPMYRFDGDDVPAQLADMQHQLREIAERLDELTANVKTVIDRAQHDREP